MTCFDAFEALWSKILPPHLKTSVYFVYSPSIYLNEKYMISIGAENVLICCMKIKNIYI